MVVDHEALVVWWELPPLTSGDIEDLDIGLLEVDVRRIAEGSEAAAAGRIDHDICLDLHQHAVRDTGEACPAAMNGELAGKRVVAGLAHRLPEKLGYVEQHAGHLAGGGDSSIGGAAGGIEPA